jgi:anthranilate phosphoribosyltransferase
LARVLQGLGLRRALVVHGDGLDDLALSGPSRVSELDEDGTVRTYEVTPEGLGVPRAPLAAILGGDAADNAVVTREILAGRLQDARRDVVALGAGAALYLAGRSSDLAGGVARALELLASGAGLEVLERYAAFSRAD